MDLEVFAILNKKVKNMVSGKKLITKYVHSSNKVIQPTALDLETGVFTCVGHGLKNNTAVVPIQNNFSNKLQNIHTELFKTGNGTLVVTEVTEDTFKIKNTSGVINSFGTTDNSEATIEKYHFEVLDAIKIDFVDIETNGDMELKIYGYCGTGDMYVGLLKDGKFYNANNSFGAFTYNGAIALSSNATHSNFRPFFSTIQLRKTPIGYMFSHDLQQYSVNNGRTVTEKTIPRRNAVIQYPYDDINGIRLGSSGHTWIPINGMTVEIYKIEEWYDED